MFKSIITATILVTLVALTLVQRSEGHGFLITPPGRSSMWRKGFNVPRNYNDNGLRCGGSRTDCGVCGDPADGPRDNEAGGKFATGTIAQHYTEGEHITVRVVVTANHEGWFEFHLCPNNNVHQAATEECLMRNVLRRTNGETRYPLAADQYAGIDIDLVLPEGVTCTQCVLRWKWITELSNKEQFYSCSDIQIKPRNGEFPITEAPETPAPETPAPETIAPWTDAPPTVAPTTVRPPPRHTPGPAMTDAPRTEEPQTEAPEVVEYTETPHRATAVHLNTGHPTLLRCFPVGVWTDNQEMEDWCNNNCNTFPAPHCPPSLCICHPLA